MRYIRDNIDILGMIQMMRPLELKLKLRSKLEFEIYNGLKACYI